MKQLEKLSNFFSTTLGAISLLVILSLLFLIPLLPGTFYANHDGEVHLVRAVEYLRAIQDGQIPPRWAPNLNFGFGSPIFIVFYPLPGYTTALLHQLGFSLEHSFLVLAGGAFIAGPIGMYLWFRQRFDSITSIMASIVYTALPYRFLTLYVRGAIGELIAFSIVPFIFYASEQKRPRIILGAFLYAFLVLSHNGVSLLFTPIFILYVLLLKKNMKEMLFIVASGLGLSAYFWIPSLLESKYTSFLLFYKDMYRGHFASFLSLISSPWGFETRVNASGGLSPQIGIPAFVVVAGVLILLFLKKKKIDYVPLFWFGVFLVGIFFSTLISGPIWQAVDFLKKFQFPWRFTLLSSFSVVCLSAVLFSRISKKLSILILVATVLYAIPFVKVKSYVTRGDRYYSTYQGSSAHRAEATPIWSPGDPAKRANTQVELISGEGRIRNVVKRTHQHGFKIEATGRTTVLDNTLYFPGWTVRVDGTKVPIQFQDPSHQGLLTFQVPQGKHQIVVSFEETKDRLLANIVSVASAFGIIVYAVLRKRKVNTK